MSWLGFAIVIAIAVVVFMLAISILALISLRGSNADFCEKCEYNCDKCPYDQIES